MSLFRKVFNSHQEAAAAPPPAVLDDTFEENDLQLEAELASGLGEVLRAETRQVAQADLPATEDVPAVAEDRPSPEVSEPQPVATEDPIDTSPSAPEPTQNISRAMDPDLVERAARAQLEIAATQNRRHSKPMPAAAAQKLSDPVEVPAVDQTPMDPPTAATAPDGPILARTRNARRVRTRMLGFDQGADVAPDPFENGAPTPTTAERLYPVGWLVVAEGPGRGHSFALHAGVSTIGRGADQSVTLDYGDTSISREKHAAIAYDDETNGFYLGHGGKSNIVRLNGRPVLSTEDLHHGDRVRVGETTLRFVALCGTEFTWGKP